MIRYAQIDIKTGIVISDSYLSGEVEAENMILIDEDFDLKNKRYINGNWIEHVSEPNETENSKNDTENNENDTEFSETERIQAEMLLNQERIITKQNEHDEILAELLLGQQKGE